MIEHQIREPKKIPNFFFIRKSQIKCVFFAKKKKMEIKKEKMIIRIIIIERRREKLKKLTRKWWEVRRTKEQGRWCFQIHGKMGQLNWEETQQAGLLGAGDLQTP